MKSPDILQQDPLVISEWILQKLLLESGTKIPVLTRYIYDVTDPYAVTEVIHPHSVTTKSWRFGRDLLRDGLKERAGYGDVTIEPRTDEYGDQIIQTKLSPVEAPPVVFEAPLPEVEPFVVRIFNAVKAGEESQHIFPDDVIAKLYSTEEY